MPQDTAPEALVRERQAANARNELALGMRNQDAIGKARALKRRKGAEDQPLSVMVVDTGQIVVRGQLVRLSPGELIDDPYRIADLRAAGVEIEVITGTLPAE